MNQIQDDDIWGMEDDEAEAQVPTDNRANDAEEEQTSLEERSEASFDRMMEQASPKKAMPLTTKILIAVGILFFILGLGVVGLLFFAHQDEPVSLQERKPATPSVAASMPHETSVQASTENAGDSSVTAIESQEQTVIPPQQHIEFSQEIQVKPTETTAPAFALAQTKQLEALEAQIKSLSILLVSLQGEAEKLAAAMRGEGMASISEEALKMLMDSNANQQSQIEQLYLDIVTLRDENKKLITDNQTLSNDIKKLQQENAKLEYTLSKREPSKRQSPPRQSTTQRNASTSEKSKVNLSQFELQGLTENFAIIKIGDQYKMWKIGENINGVSLIKINIKQGTIQTDHGTIKMLQSVVAPSSD